MTQEFEKLLSPGNIGRMTLKNRIVVPPMMRNWGTIDGAVSQQSIDHFASLAKGGVGLIITEATFVNPGGRGWYQQLGISHDRFIPGLARLVEAIHDGGCKVAAQVHHAGRQTNSTVLGMPPVAPSPVPIPGQETPRELTLEECISLVEEFGQASRRAKQAGFDAVELHAAHGYLINQFLSPNINLRRDKYGGDIQGRMTFLLEIVQRVRQLCGQNYPVIVRLNADDLVDTGLKIGEAKIVAMKLQEAGVDAIHVTVGTSESALNPRAFGSSSTMFHPRGHIVPLAAEIKSVVNMPVIVPGSITPEIGEEILEQGKADFIGMARQFLADPDLPDKLRKGKRDEIRPCIRCNEFCRSFFTGKGTRCSVNAAVGSEGRKLTGPLKKKKVVIIGGGPAGMESARVAAVRGHDVTLFEKGDKLGGHLLEGTAPDFKEDLKQFLEWQVRQVKQMGIDLKIGSEVTADAVVKLAPDVVIVATGSSPVRPEIPGINRSNVILAADVLVGKAAVGNRVVVAGGGAVGCEVALYLARRGNDVTVVEMLPAVVMDVAVTRGVLTALLADAGVKVLVNHRLTEIAGSGANCVDNSGQKVNVEADTIVLALGMKSEPGIYEELKYKIPEIYNIGDSMLVVRVGEAVRSGYLAGSSI